MQALEKCFNILFINDEDISRGRRAIFTFKNIGAMTADNNGGLLAGNITATQTKYDTYMTCMGNIDTDTMFKEGDTITKDYYMRQTFLEMHLSYYLMLSKGLAKDSAAVHVAFPHGLEESNTLNLTTTPIILNRLKIVFGTAPNLILFPGVSALYDALEINYLNARESQVDGMGTISAAAVAFLTAELELCMQLTDNVYDIRHQFPQNKVKAMSYFDEPSLYPAGHHFHQKFHGTLSALGSFIVPYNRVVTAKTHVQVKSKTAGVNISVCMKVLLTDGCPTPKQVDGIGAYSWLASAIGAGTYLILTSLNPTDPGDWDVDIID